MPKGPRGEKRPADVIGAAVLVGRIATGEVEDKQSDKLTRYHSEGGKKGGAARAVALTPEQRSEIARKAAAKRWRSGIGLEYFFLLLIVRGLPCWES